MTFGDGKWMNIALSTYDHWCGCQRQAKDAITSCNAHTHEVVDKLLFLEGQVAPQREAIGSPRKVERSHPAWENDELGHGGRVRSLVT